MNLFLLGWSPSRPIDSTGAEAALARFLEELPFFTRDEVRMWRAPSRRVFVACVSQSARETGGVDYAHFECDRMALFSGRPYVWAGDREADGRAPLDARFYLEESESWYDKLDGRWVAVRYHEIGATLEICTDALGAYHVFTAAEGGTRWFSNSAEVLRALVGGRTRDPLVLASLVVCGWSLGGQPLWREVRRLPRGTLHRFRLNADQHHELLPVARIGSFFERGFDAQVAAKTLVAAVGALADWPGRPNVVPVTGGRDSRLILAAALESGIEFEPRIGVGSSGAPESLDVHTARLVCELVGRSLTVAPSRTVATVEDTARVLRLIAPGTDTLERAWPALNRPVGSGLPDERDEFPLALVHSGHAGEVARAHYGSGRELGDTLLWRYLYRQISHVWPRVPVSREGKDLVERYLAGWVDEQIGAGVLPKDIPDVFYLLERMGNWAGAAHGVDEYMQDLTSPLWTPRLLPHELGLSSPERTREFFHFHVMNALASELARIPYAGSNPPWPTFGHTRNVRGRRMRVVGVRVRREFQRRFQYYVRRRRIERFAGLAEAVALARERTPNRSHDVWEVLDRRRTQALLGRDTAALDVRSARMAWRLATALLVCID